MIWTDLAQQRAKWWKSWYMGYENLNVKKAVIS